MDDTPPACGGRVHSLEFNAVAYDVGDLLCALAMARVPTKGWDDGIFLEVV